MRDPRLLLRKKLTWLIGALALLYIVAGFFVAPPIIRKQIVQNAATKLGREVVIERVRFNPLNLSMSLQGFALKDPDGTAFVAFDEFYVNFQTSSLFRWAYTFKEVRLDSLRTHVRVMPDGKTNFADIIETLEAQKTLEAKKARRSQRPQDAPPIEKPSIPRVVIGDIQLNGAWLHATNLQAPEPEEAAFTPVTLRLFDFTTIPNKEGDYTIGATGPEGGKWRWKGRVMFEPPSSSGTFTIENAHLERVWEIAKNRVTFEITKGLLGLTLDYSVEARGDTVVASVSNGSLSLDGFTLRKKGVEPDLFTLDSLRVSGVNVRYPEQDVSIGRVLFSGADILAWLTPAREINWLSVFPPIPADSAAQGNTAVADSAGTVPGQARTGALASAPGDSSPSPAAPLWTVSVAEIAVDDLSFAFTDSTTTPPFSIGIDPLDLTLRGVSSKPEAEFALDADATIEKTGKLAVNGVVAALPPSARVKAELSGFPLPIFQPYIKPFALLEIVSGTVGASGEIEISGVEPNTIPRVVFKGTAGSKNFVTKDTKNDENLVSWRSLDLSGISYSPERIHVSEVRSSGAYAKIVVYPDRTTNLAAVFAPSMPKDSTTADSLAASGEEAAARPKKKSSPPPIPTTVDIVKISDCTTDFSDFSLILPFTAAIHSLGGDIRGLSSVDTSRAGVTLDGSVNPSGLVTVRGEINPLRGDLYTDLAVVFKDFDLPALTPYSGHFAGREIDKGKMMLDLKYRVAQRELLGENKIVLDQLELGRKVESPDATSLPVGLAIALLKNRDGVIDLDIPVKGNLDDPKFSIKDVIFDVLVNIVTKAVMAPFSLLGKLVGFGGDDEEMSYVDFEPGSRGLTTAEQEKIVKLGEALNERPQLRLDVRGRCHPDEDSKAIKKQKFAAFVTARIQKDPKKYTPAQGAAYPVKLLRDLYDERFGKDAAKTLEERFQVPKLDEEGKPKGDDTVLDEPAFCAEIEKALTDLQPVEPGELNTLALDRSTGIKNILVQTDGVDPTRIFILDPDDQGELKDARIRLELSLSG
jgi:hypothetical protein